MLSDLGKDTMCFEGRDPETPKKVETIEEYLKTVRQFDPCFRDFEPRRMVAVGLFGTDNVEKNYGFVQSVHLGRKVDFGLKSTRLTEIDKDCGS